MRNAKVFHADDDGAAFDSGPGLFAARVLERFPHAAVEDEARMNDLGLRHHFLTKAFALAGVRAAAAAGLPALIDFHARSKLLLMAHSEALMRRLGRLLGDSAGRPHGDVAARVRGAGSPPRSRGPRAPGPNVNVLMHALGHVSDRLGARRAKPLPRPARELPPRASCRSAHRRPCWPRGRRASTSPTSPGRPSSSRIRRSLRGSSA